MVLDKIKDLVSKEKKEDSKKQDGLGTCPVCNKPVYEHEVYKVFTIQGNKIYIHKKCFKQLKKIARQMMKSGMI